MKRFSFLILFALLVIPHTTHAAWWNIFSKSKLPATTTEVVKIVNAPSPTLTPPAKEPVVRTVQVDNPELVKTIATLKAENQYLKEQITTLTTLLNQSRSVAAPSVAPTQTTQTPYVETLTAGCQAFKDQYASLWAKRESVVKESQQKLDDFMASIKKYNSLTGPKVDALEQSVLNAKASFDPEILQLEDRFSKLCPGKSLI